MNPSVDYEIRVRGNLDERWSAWFESMVIRHEEGTTTLTGPVADQAALHGLLDKVRDLNLTLISVRRVESRRRRRQER